MADVQDSHFCSQSALPRRFGQQTRRPVAWRFCLHGAGLAGWLAPGPMATLAALATKPVDLVPLLGHWMRLVRPLADRRRPLSETPLQLWCDDGESPRVDVLTGELISCARARLQCVFQRRPRSLAAKLEPRWYSVPDLFHLCRLDAAPCSRGPGIAPGPQHLGFFVFGWAMCVDRQTTARPSVDAAVFWILSTIMPP